MVWVGKVVQSRKGEVASRSERGKDGVHFLGTLELLVDHVPR